MTWLTMDRRNRPHCHRVVAVAAAGALAAAGLTGCRRKTSSHEADTSAPSVAKVATMTVSPTSSARVVEATGTVEASLTADLAPKIMSKVAAVLVDEGDRVRTGQTVVRLESADLATQVRQAEAGVQAARAALEQAKTSHNIQKTQSSTRVEQAKAGLRQAEEQLSLVKEGARKQHKQQADEGVRQAEAGKAQAEEGVQQAEAELAAAKARLSLVREGARTQQKLQADAAVRQAQAALKTAQATHARFKALLDQGAISQQRYDEVALQLEVAKAQHDTAKEQASLVYEGARSQDVQQAEEGVRQAEAALRMAKQKQREAESGVAAANAQRDLTYEGARIQEIRQAEEHVTQAREALRLAEAATDENKIRAEDVKRLQASLAQAQANLAAARVQLGYATIVTPFAGVVTKRHADPGAMASPGIPLLSIADDSGFRLEARVPESQLEGIALDGDAEVVIDSLGRTFTSTVSQIVPSADRASRTLLVKVGLPGADSLTAGLFGRVTFPVGVGEGLFVPEAALWRKGSLVGVMVIEDGHAHKRLVTLGKTDGDRVQVLSGLETGEVIVSRDVDRVPDGAAVGGGDAR